MSGPTDSVSDVARELRQAVLRWDPDARLLDNVRADDILRVCETASGAEGRFRAIDQLAAERDKLLAENERLTKALNEKQKSFCTHCKTIFPRGQEGFEQFKKHIADCPSHPLAAISRQNRHIFNLAKRVHARAVAAESERDKLRVENADLREQLEASEAILEDEEASSSETFDLWKHQKASASSLRSVLVSIHSIAKEGGQEAEASAMQYWLKQIQSKAFVVLEATTIQVTDDEGATT